MTGLSLIVPQGVSLKQKLPSLKALIGTSLVLVLTIPGVYTVQLFMYVHYYVHPDMEDTPVPAAEVLIDLKGMTILSRMPSFMTTF